MASVRLELPAGHPRPSDAERPRIRAEDPARPLWRPLPDRRRDRPEDRDRSRNPASTSSKADTGRLRVGSGLAAIRPRSFARHAEPADPPGAEAAGRRGLSGPRTLLLHAELEAALIPSRGGRIRADQPPPAAPNNQPDIRPLDDRIRLGLQSPIATRSVAPVHVAQLDRALPSEGRGWRFESSHGRSLARRPQDARVSRAPAPDLTTAQKDRRSLAEARDRRDVCPKYYCRAGISRDDGDLRVRQGRATQERLERGLRSPQG